MISPAVTDVEGEILVLPFVVLIIVNICVPLTMSTACLSMKQRLKLLEERGRGEG